MNTFRPTTLNGSESTEGSKVPEGFRRFHWLFVLMVFALGCEQPQPDVGSFQDYGKIRGQNAGYVGVDGLSGLVNMFREDGRTVQQANRITPRIDRFETIVWCPNNAAPPAPRTIERLENWLANGYYRKLIFVMPGFRGKKSLMERQVELATGNERVKAMRRYNEYLIDSTRSDGRHGDFFPGLYIDEEEKTCDWFTQRKRTNEKVVQLDGRWSEFVDAADAEIYTGRLDLEIPDPVPDLRMQEVSEYSFIQSHQRETEVLLEGNGSPIAWRMFSPDNEWIGQAYIFSNGSPLLNLGLANRENRKIAAELVTSTTGDVLVLQSGPGPIEVRDSYAPESSGWEWLQRRPLSTIVPFFLFLSVVAFFVVFPIHGRPKRIDTDPPKTFADHIRATGRLLNNPDNRSWAYKTIENYHKRLKKE